MESEKEKATLPPLQQQSRAVFEMLEWQTLLQTTRSKSSVAIVASPTNRRLIGCRAQNPTSDFSFFKRAHFALYFSHKFRF